MKKSFLVLLAASSLLSLSGCGSSPFVKQPDTTSFAASLSPAVYERLAEEWDSWNALSELEQLCSSHMPGVCASDFENWADLETFLGFSVRNPLEDCSWLEKANYCGMEKNQNIPNIRVTLQGTEDGEINSIHIECGYRTDDVRIQFWTTIYDDSQEVLSSLEKQYASTAIETESTGKYYANQAYRLNGNILRFFNVVGEMDDDAKVQDTMNRVLELF